MFTGIIETTGKIISKTASGNNIQITIEPGNEVFLNDVEKGASIAVNGVCLTITEKTKLKFSAFISSETFQIANLKGLNSNGNVNLEKALKVEDRLNGHVVMGHVDDTGIVTGIHKINKDFKLDVKIPTKLLKYVIHKGSIAINGISLTIAALKSVTLSFSIIPESYLNTNIEQMKIGDKVNLEVDMFAKYIENFQKNRNG